MSYSVAVILVAFIIQTAQGAVIPKSGCSVSVNKHLRQPQPLLLLQNKAEIHIKAFALPVDSSGTIIFDSGETIDLACPRGQIIIDDRNTGTDFLEAKCNSGIQFRVQGQNVQINRIKCTRDAYHIARYTGKKCAQNKYREIEIGFDIRGRFIKHITSCFDSSLQNAVYSQSYINPAIAGFQVGYPRPDDFIIGSFYNVKPDNVHQLYTRYEQRRTINKILGRSLSDTSVIHPKNSYFIAKGHYAAKGDFVFGSQQRLTFYYVNVGPQWQTFNGGNWNTIENDCRSLASERQLDLTVYTGSYGIATLPDVHGVEQKLYLWINRNGKKGIPVPAIFYRVVYEPTTKAGIVLIGVNNPYKKNLNEFVICKDVCNKVSWLSWERYDQELGYGYCCDVNEFRKVVKVLPLFEVKSLLV